MLEFGANSNLSRPATRERINFRWLLRLRWAAIVVQSLTVLGARAWLDIDLPLAFLYGVIGCEAATNVAASYLGRESPDGGGASNQRVLAIMIADILFLTALLYGSGGPSNPFSVFYIIHISLASATLRPFWAWCLTTMAVVCFSGLFVWHMPIAALSHEHARSAAHREHAGDQHADANWAGVDPMEIHLRGMLVAFAGAAVFVTYFVTRVRHELDCREVQLAAAERRRAEGEKVESLVTLAAGAAHELATPLATIMVAAREMELELESQTPCSTTLDDLRVIVREAGRCRDVLGAITSRAGEQIGETWNVVDWNELLEAVRSATGRPERVETSLHLGDAAPRIVAPRRTLVQTLLSLVQNGLAASPEGELVKLSVRRQDSLWQIEVRDAGCGMSEAILRRLGEPFFTTRDAGEGMGLGVFLAKRVVEQMGGKLAIESRVNSGTTVRIWVTLSGGT